MSKISRNIFIKFSSSEHAGILMNNTLTRMDFLTLLYFDIG